MTGRVVAIGGGRKSWLEEPGKSYDTEASRVGCNEMGGAKKERSGRRKKGRGKLVDAEKEGNSFGGSPHR